MKSGTGSRSLRRLCTQWLFGALLTVAGAVDAVQTVTYYHTDALGSPLAATDDTGAVVWRESYRPFGKELRSESADGTIGFTGKPHHERFGLSYFGARWYSPELGRFVSVDPVDAAEQSPEHLFNRYAYANNNPYKFFDPDGELPIAPIAYWIGKELLSYVAERYTGYSVPISIKGVGTYATKKTLKNKAKRSVAKRSVVIGENMKDRIIPFAKRIGADYYKPKNKNSDLLLRNKRWIDNKMKEGREIIDIGPDPRRAKRSTHYEMEKRRIDKHDYPVKTLKVD